VSWRAQPTAVGSPLVVAVGGGKGGVGKTLVTANLAVALADAGHAVVAVDTDLAGANLHSMLGLRPPPGSLTDFLTGREHDVAKLALDTEIPNLRFVGASGGHPGYARRRPARGSELARALASLPCDFVLLDLAAGMHPEVVDFFLLSPHGVLVVTPEPTTVENAYAFLRAALLRAMELALRSSEAKHRVVEAMDPRNERGIRTTVDLLREIHALDPEEGERCVETLELCRPRLLLNQVRSVEDIKLGFSMRSVCRRHFGVEVEYLGYVNHDESARMSVRERRPVVRAFPESDAAVYLRRIAGKLVGPNP
jgi:flagellar biosynthesis protein FlhG